MTAERDPGGFRPRLPCTTVNYQAAENIVDVDRRGMEHRGAREAWHVTQAGSDVVDVAGRGFGPMKALVASGRVVHPPRIFTPVPGDYCSGQHHSEKGGDGRPTGRKVQQ